MQGVFVLRIDLSLRETVIYILFLENRELRFIILRRKIDRGNPPLKGYRYEGTVTLPKYTKFSLLY